MWYNNTINFKLIRFNQIHARVGTQEQTLAMKYLSSERVHARRNRDLEPIVTIKAAETVAIEMRDASDNQLYPGFNLENVRDITQTEAYSLCSMAADLRITQVVNGIMGAHVMMPKAIFMS